jgi:WD40 repeat protein
VEDVRALSVRLSKRIEEMNHEVSKHIEEMNREIFNRHEWYTATRAPISHGDKSPQPLWTPSTRSTPQVGTKLTIVPCMEDTRSQLLADIMSWAENPDAPVLFWLNGLAGTGKSTVARTICDRLAKKGLIGASFFVSRQVSERRHAPSIIRTIAYQLARQRPVFAHAVSTTLRDSPDLASSQGLQKLAPGLLFNPANVFAADSGLLVVIDALDECVEDSSGRPGGELLPLLLRALLQLSGRIKVLLTSRAEPEIKRMFDQASLGSQNTVVQLHDLDSAVVRSDIEIYLTRSFARIATAHVNLAQWPTREDICAIVDLADVLFVYAATVVRFVSTPKQNPRERLDIMLSRRQGNFAYQHRFLDELYLQVLTTSVCSVYHEDENLLCDTLRTVVGSIVAAQQPLSVPVHALLLSSDTAAVQRTVESLSALLLSTSGVVRSFHPSFPDFIVNCERCNDSRFLVMLEEHHHRLARGCLALLNQYLRYNIANLKDPDVANSDIEDLESRLFQGICDDDDDLGPSYTQALSYAARYWTTHIVFSSAMDSELLDSLSRFCNEHLFHWLELLSLIGSLAFDKQSNLLAVISWSEVREFPLSMLSSYMIYQRFSSDVRMSKVGDLLRDNLRVLEVYSEPIRSHALHVFHSAYVTMPECALLETCAQAGVPQPRYSLFSPRPAHWSSTVPILEAGSRVHGVALSPDGLLVVAGMASGSSRVWSTVDFEQFPQRAGHRDQIYSVKISPDGLRMVSGSRDHTVRVWDSKTFEELGVCQHDDKVYSVAFSPKNDLIASGSADRTVRIWNILTFDEVIRLVGHKDCVRSVAFFPDGTRIVSASDDGFVGMWDARAYEPLPGIQWTCPLWVTVISPDSMRLVLGEQNSDGRDVLRLLDVVTLVEQVQAIISLGAYFPVAVAFSLDGRSIASGAESGAVHIWDASDLSHISTLKVNSLRITRWHRAHPTSCVI